MTALLRYLHSGLYRNLLAVLFRHLGTLLHGSLNWLIVALLLRHSGALFPALVTRTSLMVATIGAHLGINCGALLSIGSLIAVRALLFIGGGALGLIACLVGGLIRCGALLLIRFGALLLVGCAASLLI